jgi:hypothetical protein
VRLRVNCVRVASLETPTPDPDPDAMSRYKIIRFYHPSRNRPAEVTKVGLTYEEAKKHCCDPDTRIEGEYFDGFDQMSDPFEEAEK